MPQTIVYLLLLSLFAPLAAAQLPSPGAPAPQDEYYRAVKKATIHSRPSSNSDRTGVLRGGERVRVLDVVRGGKWYEIQLPRGGSGYVRTRFLQKEAAQPGGPASPSARSVVSSGNADIHQQPSTWAPKVGVLRRGETSTVLDTTADGKWYRIPLRQGGSGYVQAQFFRASTPRPTPQPERSGIQLKTSGGRCLDIDRNQPTGSGGGGRQVIVWQCHDGPNQQWIIPGDGFIFNYWNGRKWCLNVNSGAPVGADGRGLDVIVWPDCHGGANQRWQVGGDGFIRSQVQGLCLDVNQSDPEGKSVIVWPDCHGGVNQRWSIVR